MFNLAMPVSTHSLDIVCSQFSALLPPLRSVLPPQTFALILRAEESKPPKQPFFFFKKNLFSVCARIPVTVYDSHKST